MQQYKFVLGEKCKFNFNGKVHYGTVIQEAVEEMPEHIVAFEDLDLAKTYSDSELSTDDRPFRRPLKALFKQYLFNLTKLAFNRSAK